MTESAPVSGGGPRSGRAGWRQRLHWRAFLIPALLAVVVFYGALLRIDRLFRAYGPFDHPGWLVSLERSAGTLRPLVPASWDWPKIEQPYVGGDPINYLKYSREMRHFYQGHVREPVFLATTRGFLWLTGDQDVAVSFASLTFSVLCIVATYLLGKAVVSRWVGLLAALALAIEHEVITWAPDGWRDEAFTAFAVLSAWALVRLGRVLTQRSPPKLERQRERRWAVVAGVVGALACLTRLSSLTFLVPAWLWLAWPRAVEGRSLSAVEGRGLSGVEGLWRPRLAAVGLAAGVCTILIAPYLINSWRAHGDPLLALNYHTKFYQAAEGITTEVPTSALGFTLDKFRKLPVAATDTAVRGLVVNPFEIKWRGFQPIVPIAALVLPWLAAAGLVMWLFQPAGRLLLVMLFTSLVPYMLIWSLRGGDHWRFTLHAYPFYLVAAFHFLFASGAVLVAVARGRGRETLEGVRPRRVAAIAAAMIAIAALARFADRWAPYLVARESLATNNATTIGAGPKDGVFFGEGWSPLVVGGNVVARLQTAERSTLWVPLPARRPYRLVIRMDPIPFDGAPPQRVRVLLDGREIAALALTWNPQRVGAYQIEVPADVVPGGRARLEFVSDYRLPLDRAGSAFPELPRSVSAGLRLWYVRLTPQ